MTAPVKVGDQFPWCSSGFRTVLAVSKYHGRYPQWFNVSLTLSSPHTTSGRIEMAYDDPALRNKK